MIDIVQLKTMRDGDRITQRVQRGAPIEVLRWRWSWRVVWAGYPETPTHRGFQAVTYRPRSAERAMIYIDRLAKLAARPPEER